MVDPAERRRLASRDPWAGGAFLDSPESAAAIQERWDADMKMIEEEYGKDWRQRHQIVETDGQETFPGIEAGWMICILCHKQLAGPGTIMSHFAGFTHTRNLQWQEESLRRAEAAQARPVAPLWAAAAPWSSSDLLPPPPPTEGTTRPTLLALPPIWSPPPQGHGPPPPPAGGPPPGYGPPPPPGEGPPPGYGSQPASWVPPPPWPPPNYECVPPPPAGPPPPANWIPPPAGPQPSYGGVTPLASGPPLGGLPRTRDIPPPPAGGPPPGFETGSQRPALSEPTPGAGSPPLAAARQGPPFSGRAVPSRGVPREQPELASLELASPGPVVPPPPPAVALQDYDAEERGPCGAVESGYLRLEAGDGVELLSEPAEGHASNRYPQYVFGRRLRAGGDIEEALGWFPTTCVAPGVQGAKEAEAEAARSEASDAADVAAEDAGV